MHSRLPLRFWLECIAAVASAVSLAMTLVWPQWIEMLFGFAPDGGDGSDEWGFTLFLFGLTMLMAVLARRDWVRSAPT